MAVTPRFAQLAVRSWRPGVVGWFALVCGGGWFGLALSAGAADVPPVEWIEHNISRDGRLFAGDGGGPESVANHASLPEKRRLDPPGNGPWIYLVFRSNLHGPTHTYAVEVAKAAPTRSPTQ